MDHRPNRPNGALQAIADALGVPAERLRDGDELPETVAEANACLRLWSEIRSAEGRRRALESLRAIVDGQEM